MQKANFSVCLYAGPYVLTIISGHKKKKDDVKEERGGGGGGKEEQAFTTVNAMGIFLPTLLDIVTIP